MDNQLQVKEKCWNGVNCHFGGRLKAACASGADLRIKHPLFTEPFFSFLFFTCLEAVLSVSLLVHHLRRTHGRIYVPCYLVRPTALHYPCTIDG